MKTVTVKEFASTIGISVSRLYALWKKPGKGPPRVIAAIDGAPRVLIPLSAGLAWNEERLRHIHPKLIATGEKQKPSHKPNVSAAPAETNA